jgi:hypothetical protein
MKKEPIAILGVLCTIGVAVIPQIVDAGWIDPNTASGILAILGPIVTLFGRSRVSPVAK